MLHRPLTLAALAAAVLLVPSLILGAPPAAADEALKVGKSVPQAFGFTPLNIGIETGIFKKHVPDMKTLYTEAYLPK